LKKNLTNNPVTLRFRRWSRKGYAVFVSMTCAVTIGVLAVSVTEKSDTKAKSSISKITINQFADDMDTECMPEELAISVTVTEQIFISETINDDAAARGLNSLFIKNQTVISGVKA